MSKYFLSIILIFSELNANLETPVMREEEKDAGYEVSFSVFQKSNLTSPCPSDGENSNLLPAPPHPLTSLHLYHSPCIEGSQNQLGTY